MYGAPNPLKILALSQMSSLQVSMKVVEPVLVKGLCGPGWRDMSLVTGVVWWALWVEFSCPYPWMQRLICTFYFDTGSLCIYFYSDSLKFKNFVLLKLNKEIKYSIWVLSVIIFIIYSGITVKIYYKNYLDYSYLRLILPIHKFLLI